MAAPTGRYRPVSYFRRLVTDLMHFSAKVPSATIERHMDLVRLVAARRASVPQPTWSAIFVKAFALVAARTPLLRTSYLTAPWPRFYEHATNIGTLNVDRQLENERVIIVVHIAQPEKLTLQEIDAIILHHQQEPVEKLPSYRQAARLSRVPWPLRRWLWWAALNVFGPVRGTSLGAQGAGIVHVASLLTTLLHFGMFDSSGGLEVRLSFDHRVLDGATAAQTLADLEQVLLDEIVHECTRFSQNAMYADTPAPATR
jgi:hypothetical protein